MLEGLGFVDADYAHDGFQNGFNMLPSSAGVPSDAALEISGARAVHVPASTWPPRRLVPTTLIRPSIWQPADVGAATSIPGPCGRIPYPSGFQPLWTRGG